MLAALIHELGADPVVEQVEEPAVDGDQAIVALGAASIDPVDLAIARGTFYRPTPPLPFVAGLEGVGRVVRAGAGFAEGARIYAVGPGPGKLAERFAAGSEDAYELPDGNDDAEAVALGIAGLAGWLPLAERARVTSDDTVLVLAATGTVGSVAVQAARILGARRVVAAGRSAERLERARELGADAVVRLGGDTDLVAALRAAFEGDGPTVVLDPLWGEPGRAALEVAAPHARVVQMGQGAGAEAVVSSGTVRGKALDVLGFTNFLIPREVRAVAHRTLLEHVRAGRLTLDLTRYPLSRADDAWRAVQQGAGEKPVVVPES